MPTARLKGVTNAALLERMLLGGSLLVGLHTNGRSCMGTLQPVAARVTRRVCYVRCSMTWFVGLLLGRWFSALHLADAISIIALMFLYPSLLCPLPSFLFLSSRCATWHQPWLPPSPHPPSRPYARCRCTSRYFLGSITDAQVREGWADWISVSQAPMPDPRLVWDVEHEQNTNIYE